MARIVRIGLLGFGTVGQGVYRVIERNRDLIEQRSGARLEITRIAVRDLEKARTVDVDPSLLTTDSSSVAVSPDVDVVVELIGGSTTARDLVLEAFGAGKHVVTANKALLAVCGEQVREAAQGRFLGFEASVAGGIPVIKAVRESLAANRVLSIYGIINGTCNYILTTMRDEDRPFVDVLREAQSAGYAEADPTFDVEGIDTAHKLAILVHLAFGIPVRLDEIHTEGITSISPIDIEFGRQFGYTLKLLAIAKSVDGEVEARVHPTLVPDDFPIAQVGGVYNAVQIVGDAAGDLMFYGRGAGELPTASAVVGDIIDAARRMALPELDPVSSAVRTVASVARVRAISKIEGLYYLRFTVDDKPGVLSEISGILGRHNISIESVIQKGRDAESTVPLVIMTHRAIESDIQSALVEINGLDVVAEKGVLIRVEDRD
jgi:homoserine dehydrogenase